MGNKILFSSYFPKSPKSALKTMMESPKNLNFNSPPDPKIQIRDPSQDFGVSAPKDWIFRVSALHDSASVHGNFPQEDDVSQMVGSKGITRSFGVQLVENHVKEVIRTDKGECVVKNSQDSGSIDGNQKLLGSGFYADYPKIVSQASCFKLTPVINEINCQHYLAEKCLQNNEGVASDFGSEQVEIGCQRCRAEKAELELVREKGFTHELSTTLKKYIHGQISVAEQHVELKEKYDGLLKENQVLMIAVTEVKKEAEKARSHGLDGARYVKSVAAELSAARVDREIELQALRTENASFKKQLGESLGRLRQAEAENETLKNKVTKLTRNHKAEMKAMKQQHLVERPRPDFEDEYYDAQEWIADFSAVY